MRKIERQRKKRTVRKDAQAPKWLICCEGKSEVVYLKAFIEELTKKSQEEGKIQHNINFGVPGSCTAKPLCGACGRQHLDLYNQTVLCARGSQFEEVWMLFDLDADCDPENKPQKLKNFKDTIRQCETDSIVKSIWSIPCFEYWLALHNGNRIDVASVDSLKAQIRRQGEKAIRDKLLCDKAYRSMPRETHCSPANPVICEKALQKPYYNSFRVLGGEAGSETACKTCEKVYDEWNPTRKEDSKMDFSKIACCSNMHVLVHELHKYFDELPLRI